jgi:hypothetical protein
MKRAIAALIVLAIVLSCSMVMGGSKKGTKKLTPEEKSGVYLLILAKKGYIQISDIDTAVLIFVEPKFWAIATHADKHNLCAHAVIFYRELNTKDHHRRIVVSIRDMTTEKELARGEIETGRIDIYK